MQRHSLLPWQAGTAWLCCHPAGNKSCSTSSQPTFFSLFSSESFHCDSCRPPTLTSAAPLAPNRAGRWCSSATWPASPAAPAPRAPLLPPALLPPSPSSPAVAAWLLLAGKSSCWESPRPRRRSRSSMYVAAAADALRSISSTCCGPAPRRLGLPHPPANKWCRSLSSALAGGQPLCSGEQASTGEDWRAGTLLCGRSMQGAHCQHMGSPRSTGSELHHRPTRAPTPAART